MLGDRGRRWLCRASSQQLSDSGFGLGLEAFPLGGSAKGTSSRYRPRSAEKSPPLSGSA